MDFRFKKKEFINGATANLLAGYYPTIDLTELYDVDYAKEFIQSYFKNVFVLRFMTYIVKMKVFNNSILYINICMLEQLEKVLEKDPTVYCILTVIPMYLPLMLL